MYSAAVVKLATNYSTPRRLIGKRGAVYGAGERKANGMQVRQLFG